MLALTGLGSADEHFPFLGEVSRGPVNVRAGANTNFEAVDKLSAGAPLVVIGRNYEWYQVQLSSSASAFIRADYIQVHDANAGEITGTRINVRAKPAAEASPLGQVNKGDLVRLIAKTNDWWKVEAPFGTSGWVHADFVKLKSKDVPAHLVQKPLAAQPVPQMIDVPKVETPAATLAAKAPVLVAVEGRLERLAVYPSEGVQYQVLVNGVPVYYLKDAPRLERFERAIVRIEGTAADGTSTLLYPVLHIKKISFVL